MCYPKPGPRCTSHAVRLLRKRKEVVDSATTDLTRHIARVSYEEARSEFYATKGGLRYLCGKALQAKENNDERASEYWSKQLKSSEQLRDIRMSHLKSLRDAPEPKEAHHSEETQKPSKFLGITLNKDSNVPSGRYLDAIAPLSDFQAALNADLITVRSHPHPSVPYVVLDYSRSTQYTNAWNTVTVNARGLIVNKNTGEIVSRPFRKFFNHNQDVGELTNFDRSGEVVVTSKEDGSMTSLFNLPDGSAALSTRGSMDSEQARRATRIYHERYDGKWNPDPKRTYIYEVILPENRIVVDYGDKEDIVLIGAVDKNTGRSVALGEVTEWKGERAHQYTFSSYSAALSHKIPDNEEGVVVHFLNSDERVKIKGENYLRLHKIATGLNTISVWEKVSTSTDDSWIGDLPDEFSSEINTHAQRMRNEHSQKMNELQSQVKASYDACGISMASPLTGENRKILANYIGANFSRTDTGYIRSLALSGSVGKISQSIWRDLRPHGNHPLFNDEA